MEPKPLVSIVIPTYNRANYIIKTIQSLLVQTFSNFEILVIDDGSTDNTDQIMQQVDDPRVT
jgi:glycosyltransferase involved in cell wall biosynthesis